jgi:hypothetical protein
VNDRTGRTPASGHDDGPSREPAGDASFNPVRLLLWCSLTLGGSAAIVWVSWFTSGPMSWPMRFVWWSVVLGALWLLARKARRFLEAQGWNTSDAPPSEHALRGAALIGGIVLSTALLGSTAGRQMVLSAADAVPGVRISGAGSTDGPTVITLPPTTAVPLRVETPAPTTSTTVVAITLAVTETTIPGSPPASEVATTTSLPAFVRGDDATAAPGQPVVIDVLANDGTEYLPASVTIVVEPNGTAVVNADGTITVTLAAGVTGTQSFVYRACTAGGACQNGVVRILLA